MISFSKASSAHKNIFSPNLTPVLQESKSIIYKLGILSLKGFVGKGSIQVYSIIGNKITDIEVQNLWTADAVLVLFGITVFTAIVSALYPSFYLNSFEAGSILRGLKLSKLGGSNIRNGLLAVQLVAAILMISGSLIIKNQIEFINSKDLGFEKENLMVMDISGEPFSNKIETLKTALAVVPGISGASAVSNVPGGQINQHSF